MINQKMETTIVYRGCIGMRENQMEIVIMENQMEKDMENENPVVI